jgi:MFS family permease
MSVPRQQATRTLWLCGALHAFTHLYTVSLVPLYLLIRQDFKLVSDGQATLLVTIQGLAYVLPSYFLGVLADRFSRKRLLTVGLALNGIGFAGLAVAPNYALAMVCLALAGFGGSFYHPAATAMVVRLFPVGTGKALGRVGMGAGLGFFLGPIYTGWRAATAGWRVPLLELGLMGILAALVFWWWAEEEPAPVRTGATKRTPEVMFGTIGLWGFFVAAALAFSLRDFAGGGMTSLSSLFLQRAWGFDSATTGLALGSLSLMAMVSNPLFGSLSDRGRFRWISLVLLVAGGFMVLVPWLARPWLIPVLLVYGFFFMASFPMVEAALMESVPDAVRGRVMGLFITICGTAGSLSHWLMGEWVKGTGQEVSYPGYYRPLYGGLAVAAAMSLAGLPCLNAIRRRRRRPDGADRKGPA